MEHLISKLLQELERGQMTRRQLIQSLTLTVTAATAANSRAMAAPGGKGFKAIAVNHISYEVADYAKTRDLYADFFGMKVSQDERKQCYLTFGDNFLIPRNGPAPTPRIDHISYTIANWDKNAVEAGLKRRGLHPKPDTENSFHVEDLNGLELQISGQELKA